MSTKLRIPVGPRTREQDLRVRDAECLNGFSFNVPPVVKLQFLSGKF